MIDPVFASALSVFLVSFLMSLSTSLLNRKLANRATFAGWQEEINRWNADKELAKKTGDKKLAAKLKKQEKRVSQMQSKMLKGQTVSMVVNIGLFFVVWQALIFFYADKTVAYLPFSIPFAAETTPYPLSFFYWYFVCSFFSSSLLSRVLGGGMGMGMQPRPAG